MDWKKLGKKLLFLPSWLVLLLTAVSGALLALVFLKRWDTSPVAYGTYALSFYTLCVLILWCVFVLPKQWRGLKARVYASTVGNRYMTDRAFRTKLSLQISFGVDMLYVAVNLLSWYMARSWWFVVLAAYYLILAVMRYLLMGFARKNELGENRTKEWRRARTCAYILLLINLSLSGAVLMILYQGKGYEQHGLLIYVIALYTFYSATKAIIDVVKYRRMESPVRSTAKVVSLCSALVSMLNLETAMFAQFGGDMAVEDQHLMIMLTGAGVSIVVATLSITLISQATKAIRREKNGKE